MKTLNYYLKHPLKCFSGFKTIMIDGDNIIITADGFKTEKYYASWDFTDDVEKLAVRIIKQFDIKLIYRAYGRNSYDAVVTNTFNHKSADAKEVCQRLYEYIQNNRHSTIVLTIEEFLSVAYHKYMDLDDYIFNEKYYHEEDNEESFRPRRCTWVDRQSAAMHFNSLAGDTHWL